jgi:hypothetical protein
MNLFRANNGSWWTYLSNPPSTYIFEAFIERIGKAGLKRSMAHALHYARAWQNWGAVVRILVLLARAIHTAAKELFF